MSITTDKFITILKENGVKVTTQRILVLEALSSCPDGHLTAEVTNYK